eukprot:4245517-Prymnesium_polylepis.1
MAHLAPRITRCHILCKVGQQKAAEVAYPLQQRMLFSSEGECHCAAACPLPIILEALRQRDVQQARSLLASHLDDFAEVRAHPAHNIIMAELRSATESWRELLVTKEMGDWLTDFEEDELPDDDSAVVAVEDGFMQQVLQLGDPLGMAHVPCGVL